MPKAAEAPSTQPQQPAAQTQPNASQSYEQHKAQSGALGLGQPGATNPNNSVADGWSKAVKNANASIGVK